MAQVVNRRTAGRAWHAYLVLDSQILLACRTLKQRIYILKRHVRSLRNPIRRPYIRGKTGRREDQESDPSIQDQSSQYPTFLVDARVGVTHEAEVSRRTGVTSPIKTGEKRHEASAQRGSFRSRDYFPLTVVQPNALEFRTGGPTSTNTNHVPVRRCGQSNPLAPHRLREHL